MKILHISSASTWRGGERQIHYLIEGLKNEGHINYLMCPTISILGYRTKSLVQPLVPFRKGMFALIRNVLALIKACDEYSFDIIHGHDSHAHTVLWMAYNYGGLTTKSVITRRLINPIKKRSILKYNYAKIEKIICISDAVKRSLSNSIQDANRLEIIYSSIKLDNTQTKKIAFGQTNFTIGYVAAFTAEKDHATLISTAEYLVRKHPEFNFEFHLVGDGPLKEECVKQSKKLGLNLTFLGFIEEVDQAYEKMDLLLHTSKSEALGTAILDAMKFGLPIVSTTIGGIPEIVHNGENGFLNNPGDYKSLAESIVKICSSNEMYAQFSQNNTKILRKFDVDRMILQTIEVYNDLLNG